MFWLLLAGCLHRDLAPNVAMTLARIAVDEQRGWGHEPEAAFSLDQANVAPGIVAPLASAAVAANCCVAPTAIEAPLGAMVTDATTGGGGGAPLSLQLPNVLVAAAAHDPSD